MKLSLAFIRNFFLLLSVLVAVGYATNALDGGLTVNNLLIGVSTGLGFGLLVIAAGRYFERFNLRAFNVAAIGLGCGYLMGQAILVALDAVFQMGTLAVEPQVLGFFRILVFLFSVYLAMVLTARASEELTISIPFVKFTPTARKKKDILVDASVLADTRLLDLLGSGLVDNQVVLPRYILVELQAQVETGDDNTRSRARRSLDIVKKMEGLPGLGLRFTDTDIPEVKEPMLKLVRLARLLDTNILTADINRIQQSEIEGVKVVNIHTLANALKPVAQAGEFIDIKVQRYGKEQRQGVGYLDDGTMVVINGGAEYIGDTIKARVLSVKHTSSGRMIFCNTMDEAAKASQAAAERGEEEPAGVGPGGAASRKYFSV